MIAPYTNSALPLDSDAFHAGKTTGEYSNALRTSHVLCSESYRSNRTIAGQQMSHVEGDVLARKQSRSREGNVKTILGKNNSTDPPPLHPTTGDCLN